MVDSEDNSEYDSDSMGEEDSVADPSLPNDPLVEPPPDPIVRVEELIQMEPEDSPGGVVSRWEMGNRCLIPKMRLAISAGLVCPMRLVSQHKPPVSLTPRSRGGG